MNVGRTGIQEPPTFRGERRRAKLAAEGLDVAVSFYVSIEH